MNKKGSMQILVLIIELLVVIAVSFSIATVTNMIAKSETTLRINMANDFVMISHTLAALPGDSVVEYPKDVSKYTFVMEQEKLTVFMKGENKFKHYQTTFNLPQGYKSSGNLEQKKRLCLEKISKTIRLRECKKDEQ